MLQPRFNLQVITIDSYTGRLLYTAHPGVDLFGSVTDALAALRGPTIMMEYCALVGMVVLVGEVPFSLPYLDAHVWIPKPPPPN